MTANRRSRRANVAGTIYIAKFAEKIGNPDKRGATAQFYIGWTEGAVEGRWQAHRQGAGAKITAYVAAQGIDMEFKVLETGVTRERERRIKTNGHYDRQWARASR